MTKDFSEQILQHLAGQRYQPKKVRQLAKALGVAEQDYSTFRSDVDRLRRTGRVVMGAKNAVVPPRMTDRVVGTYRANPRGFGFVVPTDPDAHEDLYIPEGQQLDAVTGDMVAAEIARRYVRDGRKMLSGRIVEIIARGHNRFVGTLVRIKGRHFVEPDGKQFTDLVAVADATACNAKLDDKVVVELTQYPTTDRMAEGVIVEVLGPRGDPGVDTLTVLRQFHIPDTFPEAVLDEAGDRVRAFDPADAGERTDLRGELIVTIDPARARDFDDAISLERLDGGRWRLGVHIADVSHFTPPGSALDAEARERGNSVYFPNHVVPMLPEVLSNGACSLQEGVDRLVKSVHITYDADGRVVGEEYCNAVIRSARRLTYEQAQSAIDGKPTDGLGGDVLDLLRRMNELARVLFARRRREGMLHLDLPAVELVLDEDGRVVDAHPEDASFSHTIIEMFMVEANEAVARLLDRVGVPFMRRIHPEPAAEDFNQLSAFVRICGHSLPRKLDRFAMQKLLANVKGKPESYAVNLALLRSFEQAVYSPKDEGHFALASRHYCHFTSPIRRYPDLTVHRLLDDYFAGRFAGSRKQRRAAAESDGTKLAELGRHCSVTERRAEQAERELRELKVLELLSGHVGEQTYGVVTQVTGFGLFVQCSRYLIDGLIRFNDLTDDWWELQPRAGAVVGQRSGKRIQIGDLLLVQIVEVDLPRRELDLRLVADLGRKGEMADLMAEAPAADPRPPAGKGRSKRPNGREQKNRRGKRRGRGR